MTSLSMPTPTSDLSPERAHLLRQQAMAYSRICVVGLGYVGLPTALLFARNGFAVQGVDVSERVLQTIAESRVGAAYPELSDWWEAVLRLPVKADKPAFRAAATPDAADVFIITVPTPVDPVEKTCDLSMVRAAAESILPVLQPGNLVILESTVPPGTTRGLLKNLIETRTALRVDQDMFLCFSPERVLPGNTTRELVQNDRVVGGVTPEAALVGRIFLARVLEGHIYPTDDMTAEFCKLAENTYRDVNIALANELSVLADEYAIDINEARALINMHPRVNLLKPGIGVGGHCIAVDPWFFVEASPINTRLIATSRQVNDRMPQYTVDKILAAVADLENPRICLLGLSYKPDVADPRESPAMRIAELLSEKSLRRKNPADRPFTLVAYDPLLPESANPFFNPVHAEPSNGSAAARPSLLTLAEGADYLGILVSHTVLLDELTRYRSDIEAVMRTPRIHVF